MLSWVGQRLDEYKCPCCYSDTSTVVFTELVSLSLTMGTMRLFDNLQKAMQ